MTTTTSSLVSLAPHHHDPHNTSTTAAESSPSRNRYEALSPNTTPAIPPSGMPQDSLTDEGDSPTANSSESLPDISSLQLSRPPLKKQLTIADNPEDDSIKAVSRASSSSSDASDSPLYSLKQSLSHEQLSRRRLSVVGQPEEQSRIDGAVSTPRSNSISLPAPISPINKPLTAAAVSSDNASPPAPVKYAAYTHTQVGYIPFNTRKVNQDRALISTVGPAKEPLFAVCDGHGTHGHDVSQYLVDHLPRAITDQMLKSKYTATDKTVSVETIREIMTAAFATVNRRLRSAIDCSYSGSTCNVAYMHGSQLFVINVGDSRAVMATTRSNRAHRLKAVDLSLDHKPEIDTEKQRIQAAGGRVEPCRDQRGTYIGPQRVWLKTAPTPGLGMSRAFGDDVAASVGVICTPDVTVWNIESEDQFLLLASDGVYELLSSQEAINVLAEHKPVAACKALVEEAVKRWRAEESVVDDTTCIGVFFQHDKSN